MQYDVAKPHVMALLKATGFEPTHVAKVAINTSGMVVTVFDSDDNGRFRLNATNDGVLTTDIHVKWDDPNREDVKPLAS